MKNRLMLVVFGLLAFLGFSITANAVSAPSTIRAGKLTYIPQYVSGYDAYLKTNSAGDRFLYCEVANLKFPSNLTLKLGSEVDKGFVYILQNRPWTGDTNKDYYIMQMATWWYRDVLTNSNSNLSSTFKNHCINNRNNDSTCAGIYNLVEGAKSYQQTRGNISFSNQAVTFTQSGSYYVSSTITVTSNWLTSFKGVKLVGAPSGSTIINSNIYNNNGTFQVRVPMSSVSVGRTITFSVEAEGAFNTHSAYDYYYSSAYQRVIYDVVYNVSHPAYASKTMTVSRDDNYTTTTKYYPDNNTNSLTIYKIDQYEKSLRGAELRLYSGNCLNTVCSSRDVYSSWTSTNSAKVFYDIPTGYYTIEETSAPNGYRKADKGLVYVSRTDMNYEYKVVNVKDGEMNPVRISKTDITGQSELAGATLVLKNSYGNVVETWVSTNSAKYFTLEEGEYSLTEKFAPAGYKLNTTTIYFRVDSNGNIYAKNEYGSYELVDYVRMVNEVSDMVNISKLDKSTNNYLSGATLVIKNEKGEVVSTWVTTNESYNISLEPGEYSITETNTPHGYINNTSTIYFRVLENGTVMLRNDSGVYEVASGIIIYNYQEASEEVVVVPKTGLSSTLTYIIGSVTLISGAWMLIKNGKLS